MHSIDSKRIFVSLFLVAFLVVLVLPAYGQERFGNVTGVVKDQTGAVLPGVAVTITNKDTNRSVTVHSRSDGSYTLADVEPGHYSVTFVKTGFTGREVADIVVLVGRNTSVSIELQVGTVQEMVEVSGVAPVIDTTATMIAHNVTAEELDRLPKTRNFQSVAVFSPSVNTGFVEGGYQINGASAAENNYYIDGVSTNSMIDGSARQ
ncbi:MAG: carboxypeptidase-like regulatory domain-containing protein, partial [Terriglobales bacterium]